MADDETQLLTFCTASVDLYARSIVDPATVSAENIQKDIQSFMSKLDKSKAQSVGKALFCLELQYRNGAMYERFLSTKKKIEDSIEEMRNTASSIREATETTPNRADLQQLASKQGELSTLASDYLKFYTSCFPLRHRVRYAPALLSISPICSFKTAEFEIDSSCEYLLLEKQQLKWKVQERDKTNLTAGVGPELLVPSLFFFVHWLTDDAESIQRLIGRVRDTFAACVVALNLQLGKLLQDAQVRTAFPSAQLEQIGGFVLPLPNDPDNVTKAMICTLQSQLTPFLQRLDYPDLPEKQKSVVAVLTAIQSGVNAYLAVPESVPDRSKVVFNRRLRIDGRSESGEEKLVRIEWKMELVLNKCVTTTETTEVIPKHVDVDRFKQSEQELERKMVIQAVVDPKTDTEISLDEAVQKGIINYGTGTYNDREKNESMTIDEAIMRGLIQVEFVAVQASEEKLKNYGVLTVIDPASKSELHYVVHVAIDRKANERLEYDKAVERGILDLENSTYWDSLENEMMPIADALDKGYLKGRKVENPNELQDLAKSQADIVKTRLKKLTSTMGILKGLRKSTVNQ